MKRAAAGLFLVVLAVYWKLLLPGYVWFDHYDLCQFDIPRLQFIARSLHAGHFPLWDPHVWAGLPVLGSGQPGPVYPLNLLFLAMPLHHEAIALATLNWWFIAIHLVAALSCFLLCRDLEFSPAACALGGLAYACAGYFGSMPWIDRTNGASLAPLILLFAIRIWMGRRPLQSSALLGLVLGLCWLSGHHEIPLIVSYAVLLGTVAVWAWRRRIDGWMPLAFVLAGLIGAVQTLPVYEFGRLAKRWVGAAQPVGWRDVVPYEIHARYSVSWKDLLGLVVPTPTVESHTYLFVGFGIALLACMGLAGGWRNRASRYVTLIGAGALLYSLGANTPVHRTMYALLPMLDKARTPVRAMFLVSLALAVLAACGLDIILKQIQRPIARVAAAVVLVLVVALEATTVAKFRITPLDNRTVCAASMLDHREELAQLRALAGSGRIAASWATLLFNPGDQYGFDQYQSFVAGVPANMLNFMLTNPQASELLGVTARLGRNGVEAVPGAMPRAWAEMACSPTREPVAVSRPDSDTVVLSAKLACPGKVILSDTMYPGWEATIDGGPVPIHEAMGALRSVAVDAGTHRIEMRYQPASVRIGGGLTAVGLAAFLAMLVRSRSR